MANTNYQYEPLPVPSSWGREERQFAQRLSDILDDIFMRYGRLGEKELGAALRTKINSKLDGSALANYSTTEQTATRISAAVSEVNVGGRNLLLGTPEAITANADGLIGSYELAHPYTDLAGADTVLSFGWTAVGGEGAQLAVYLEDSGGALVAEVDAQAGSGHASVPYTIPAGASAFTRVSFYASGLTGAATISKAQLERGNKATDWGQADGELIIGTELSITKDGVRVNGPSFSVGRGGDQYMSLDSSGGYFPKLASPQVAPRYDGPTALTVNSATPPDGVTYFTTLYDAMAVLRGRWIDSDVAITVAATYADYNPIDIAGIYGSGSLTIDGGSVVGGVDSRMVVYNAVRVANCGVPVTLDGIKAKHNSSPLSIFACAYVLVQDCVFETTAGVAVISVDGGATVRITGTTMAAGNFSMRAYRGSRVTMQDCTGDKNICSEAAFVSGYGTMPSGSSGSVTTTAYQNGYISDTGGMTVSQGSGAGTIPSAPATGDTETLYPRETAWHQDIWCDITQIGYFRQGYTGYGQITGCVWFDMSSLAGKSAAGVKLRLTRSAGYGFSEAVSVRMMGLGTACTGRGTAMTRTADYGTVGKILPGETKEFTLPNAAGDALINGTIGGLCVFVSDAAKAPGYLWSVNYAQFMGTSGTDATKPKLTIYT